MRNRNNNSGRPMARRAEQYTNLPIVKEPMELMDFLVQKGNMSRNKVKTLLTHRAILVNKTITTQYNFMLQPGMLVQLSKNHHQKEFKSTHIRLVYEDAYLLVIEKREGLLAVGSDKQKEMSAYSILTDYVKRSSKQRRIYGVHRLDREASGLMVFAKDERTKQNLQDNWERLFNERTFVAVVEGDMEKDRGIVCSWLVDGKAYVVEAATTQTGDKAVSHYNTIKRANGFSMLEIALGNGRKEQVRTHMAELNHPIVGDLRYNGVSNPLRRLALHAFRLNFQHPVTGENLKFELPYPLPFRQLVQRVTSDEGEIAGMRKE